MIENNVNQNFELIRRQIEQIDQEEEEAEGLVLEAVGKILLHIGERKQLLRVEKLEFERENRSLQKQIPELKNKYETEWEEGFKRYKTEISMIAEKIRILAARSLVVHEYLNANKTTNLSSTKWVAELAHDLKSTKWIAEYLLNAPKDDVENHDKSRGMAKVWEEMDRVLGSAIFAQWLNNITEEVEDGATPEYNLRDRRITRRDFQPAQENAGIIVTLQSNRVVSKFISQEYIEQYRALEKGIALLKEENTALKAEHEWMAEAHHTHMCALKHQIARRILHQLNIARLIYAEAEDWVLPYTQAEERIKKRSEPLLAGVMQLIQGDIQETKLIQSCLLSIIKLSEAIICEYGKEAMIKPVEEVVRERLK